MSVQEDAQALYAVAAALPIGAAEAAQDSVATVMELTQSVYHQLGETPGRVTHALGETHPSTAELAGLAAQVKDRAEEISTRVVQLDTDMGEHAQQLHMLHDRLEAEADRLMAG